MQGVVDGVCYRTSQLVKPKPLKTASFEQSEGFGYFSLQRTGQG